MSNAEEVELCIKFMINKEKTKVLFAEAGSDFTDVLLSLLFLPLGTIVKVLEKHYGDEAPVIGSLKTLYNGVANLDSIHFPADAKNMLLNPRSPFEHVLQGLKLSYTQPTSSDSGKKYDGTFTKSAVSFIISDDLRVMPNVAGSVIETLSNLSLAMTDMDGAETKIVTFGFNEVMALLKEMLTSRYPLTTLLLRGSGMNLATEKSEQGSALLLNQIDEKTSSMNPKKMILKVMIQKSTYKLLFAQADDDFINFLFGLLTLPLGSVEWYLGSDTGLKNMDNLHRSIAADNLDKYLSAEWVKKCLINPNFYSSSNEFFPLNFDPNNNQNHVEGSRMYMVRDDLTVAPLGIISSLYLLNELKISLSDVKELELQVGLEEGLSIVKAALTSTTALTDGLIKPMLKKQLKQES